MNRPNVASAFKPEDYRGETALVLIFAPSRRSPVFEAQWDLLAQAAEEMQHILVARILVDGESRAGERRIDRDSVEELRVSYGVDPEEFRIVLIGIGGAERRRADAPLQPEAILRHLPPPS